MDEIEEKINLRLSQYRTPFSDNDGASAKNSVMLRTVLMEEPIQNRVGGWSIAAAAAVLVAILSLPFLLHFFGSTTKIASVETNFTLPDGSEVELMPKSRLSYNDWTWWLDRSVSLNGEALFIVHKGDRFTVKTTTADVVEVVGTVFSVRTDASGLMVHCKEGAVKINQTLIRGGEFVYKEGEDYRKGTWSDQNILIAPLAESLQFERQPLSRVIAALESRFDRNLQLKVKNQILFSGSLDKDNLENSLTQLCRSLGLKFEEDHEVVVIFEP